MALRPKTNPIYEDYVILKDILGVGISGKVLICKDKKTETKYALKVIIYINLIKICFYSDYNFIKQTLRDTAKARREIDLQWRACQGCQFIVQIKDVYENVINTQKVLLVVMECMTGGELFAKISERTQPFTEQGMQL